MIRKVFPVIGLTVFSVMLGMGILNPILPIYAKDVGATGVWIGFISGGYAVSRAVFTPFIGRWSDRSGRKIFLGSGLLAYALISLLYALSEGLPFLFTVRLLHGAVSGMILPIAQSWIGDVTPRGEEGKWQGYYNTALYTGSACGPFLGGMLADIFNIDAAFAAMGFLNFIAFVAVTAFLKETTERKDVKRAPLSFRKLGESPMFQALFAQRTALELSMATVTAFLPIFAFDELGMSRSLIGALVGGGLLTTSWLQLATGRLADRFDRRRVVIISSWVTFGIFALIPFAGSTVVLVSLVLLRYISASFSMPSSSALSVELGRRFGMGTTIALLGVATSVGMGLGPISSGFVYDFMGGITSVFYYAGGIGFIGTSLFAWLSHKAESTHQATQASSASTVPTDQTTKR
jgi:DHA1 family multidrug resistance protein-like MFS transporter